MKFKAWAAAAVIALTGVGGSALVASSALPASAHTPKVTAKCGEVKVNLTNYGNADPSYVDWNNTVTVTIDGVVVKSAQFGGSFSQTFTLTKTEAHTWSVVVDANVNAGDPTQYDWSDSGSIEPCESKKVSICHRDQGNPEWKVIEISENALDQHLNHQWGEDIYPVPADGCPVPPPTSPCDAPTSGGVTKWLDQHDSTGRECFDFTAVQECGSASVTLTKQPSWLSPYRAVWNETNTVGAGFANFPASFTEDYNGGEVTIYWHIRGPEGDYFPAGNDLPNFWNGTTLPVVVDTDCAPPETVPPTNPPTVPPTEPTVPPTEPTTPPTEPTVTTPPTTDIVDPPTTTTPVDTTVAPLPTTRVPRPLLVVSTSSDCFGTYVTVANNSDVPTTVGFILGWPSRLPTDLSIAAHGSRTFTIDNSNLYGYIELRLTEGLTWTRYDRQHVDCPTPGTAAAALTLPSTGSDTGSIALLAVIFAAIGGVVVASTKRRNRQPDVIDG